MGGVRRRICVVCPVRDRAWVLPEWLAALEAQRSEQVGIEVVCFDDGSSDGSPDLLREAGAVVLSDRSWRSPLTDDEAAQHAWTGAAYEHMARMRNALAEHVWGRFDYVLTLDTDVILAPGTVDRLLDGLGPGEVVAPLVNVARLRRHVAWNYLYWVDRTPGVAWRPPPASWLPFDGRYPVGVVCAAYLMPGDGPRPLWTAHRQGEDVGWCWDAQRLGLRVLIDTREITRHVVHRRPQPVG